MRVAAVAFVLIVGAAVVLAFANTLNSGVLGGLLGGLAAILLCIPISLAIFTWLTRRQEARQRAAQALEAEEHFADEAYENDLMVYEAEGYVLPMEEEEDVLPDPRGPYLPASRRMPVSGYLPLPPVEQEYDYYGEDDSETLVRRSPRNYPRQPRYPARSLAREEIVPAPPTQGSTRHPATHSLSQHQSAALRKARQEAQQQQRPQRRSGSSSLSRRPQRGRPSSQRPRTSHSLHAREDTSDLYPSEDEYETYRSRQQSSWEEEEDFASSLSTEELREGYQQYPRRAAYPRNPRNPRTLRPRSDDPWTGELDDEDELDGRTRSRRPRRDADRTSKDLRSPLVRRAPYLYDDDPLNEEFTRQLDNDHPIARRSTRIERYRQED